LEEPTGLEEIKMLKEKTTKIQNMDEYIAGIQLPDIVRSWKAVRRLWLVQFIPFSVLPYPALQCSELDLQNGASRPEFQVGTKASDSDLYEIQRAQEINQIFGPKGSSQAYDFMLDLHNTTANMGSCLLLKSEFSLLSIHMCNYIQKHCRVRHCPILLCQLSGEETTFMMSVAKHGLALELGPQPQGVARADQLTKMRSIVVCALDFIELFNKGTLFPAFEIEAYRPVEQKDFPRYPNGEISAVIHPDLQDKDFQPLKPGDPVFQNFDGEDILHDGDDTFFPVFINEAAYYEKKIAFWKTKKETFTQPALQKTF
ncbi:hypothetical protein Chor_016175, partial [Crotalus horridus]